MGNTIDWCRYTDIAGQLPSLQSYTQLCLFFPGQRPGLEKDLTLRMLADTSVKLTSLFPWLSGKVANEGGGVGSSGVFKIVPHRAPGTGFEICVREDVSLDYQDMNERKMPMTMLDGKSLSPKYDLTRMYDLAKAPIPVLVLQVTFLRGGIAIAFAGAHNALDMSGLGQLIDLFGRILRGGEVTKHEIEWGNRDRRKLFTLLGPSEAMLDHTMLVVDPAHGGQERNTESPPGKPRWAYIRFESKTLALLKKLASSQESDDKRDEQGSASDWISTDDAISAFLWQRITQSRHPHVLSSSSSAAEISIVCRAVNGRRFLNPPIPASYMGQMVSCTFNSFSLASLKMQDLSKIARELRDRLNQQNDHSTRSLFSFIHEKKDKSLVSFTANMDLSRDLLISSGAGLRVYHADFGPIFGSPEWVRRPRWDSTERVIYLMPKTREGNVDVAACLREQDWERLRRDEAWNQFTQYIG